MTEHSELPQLCPAIAEIPPNEFAGRTFMVDGKPIVLAESQAEVLCAIKAGKNVFLTGEPGTGKSVVVKVLRILRLEWMKSVAFMGPTGIAALQIQGSTINSFFNFPPKPLHLDFGETKGCERRIRELIQATDILVLDEVSMIRSDVFTAIYKACQSAMGNLKPFGGKQVVLVGDFFQLPPVVEDQNLHPWLNMLFGGVLCCHSHSWRAADIQTFGLVQNQRQKQDDAFAEALQLVRIRDPLGLELINQMVEISGELKGTVITFVNDTARRINEERLMALTSQAFIYKADKTKFAAAPVDSEITLKVGARVMLMANTAGFVNGDLGEVTRLYATSIEVKLDRGPRVSVEPYTWDKTEYVVRGSKLEETTTGGFTQLPVKLGWAITSHKSQGQTLDHVTLPMETVPFEPAQLYVALSRVRSAKNLTLGRPLKPRDMGLV